MPKVAFARSIRLTLNCPPRWIRRIRDAGHALRFGGLYQERCIVDAPENRIGQLQQPMLHFNDEEYPERIRKSATYVEEIVAEVAATGRAVTGWSIAYTGFREFLKRYFLKGGLWDGVPGLISAVLCGTAVFPGHACVWDKQNRIGREILEQQVTGMWATAGLPEK